MARDCALALSTGASIDIQHISSGTSVAIVRAMKALGKNIHAEATPQHFSLTEEAVLAKGTLAKSKSADSYRGGPPGYHSGIDG